MGSLRRAGQGKQARQGKDARPAYPTLTYDEIADFRVGKKPVREIAFKDAVLFLWCTSANLAWALNIMDAWGFTYKSHAIWDKQVTGLGLVFRNRHELLLYGTRGP
jgi:N6-adenosine-specific RNA methylase IME4